MTVFVQFRNELPVPLRLPHLIDQVESREDLLLLAQVANPAGMLSYFDIVFFSYRKMKEKEESGRLNIPLAEERVEGAGWVAKAWILIGLFVDQNPNCHWVMQTEHSAWFATMGGAMGRAEVVCCGFLGCCAVPSAKDFPKFRLKFLFCWSNITILPKIENGNVKLKARAN